VPVGAAALILLARTERSPHRKVPLDWVGPVTAVLAMGGLTYGAIEAGADGLGAPGVVTAFGVAVVALAAFVAAQARGAHPMVPLELFRSRTVSVAVAVGFAFIVGYYGLPFMMSLYLQQLRGLSSLATGMAFLPMMLVGAVLTPFSARIAERLGARLLICGGLALMTAGLAILALVPPSTPSWALAGLMVLIGLAGRPPGLATGDRGPAEQRSRTPSRHGQRRVQHQPPGRGRPGRGRLRRPAGPAGDVPAGPADQPAARGRGRARRGGGQPAAAAPRNQPQPGGCTGLSRE
jgi:hypothetical protein